MKVTYIISNIEKSLAFEWVANYLNKDKIELSFILINPTKETPLYHFLINNNISTSHIHYSSKKDSLKAIFKTYRLLKNLKTNIIHTHFLDANLVGLIAGKLAGIKKRIHTRHHGSEHHTFAPKGVKYDKLSNYLSTDIIAISKNVSSILEKQEGVSKTKTHLINHGFDFSLFQQHDQDNVNKLKQKYNITTQAPIIGVISRYTKGKGLQHIIPAFKNILIDFPGALLILANANGDYKKEVQKLLKEIPQENQLEIIFETEIHTLYQLFDIFIHAPINEHYESFGQIYIEALISNIPSVFTLSGIAREFIKHKHNAWVVDFESTAEIENGIREILTNEMLKNNLIKNGPESCNQFALPIFIEKLNKLYTT